MKRSKIFIFILALMSTLLMAVACDSAPSILESTADNNGCVPAYLNVMSADSRGIEVTGLDTAITYYRVALIPEWSTLDSGAPIYGQIGTRTAEGGVEYGEKTFASQSSIELGYVTPGKWTVYVSAYNKDKKMIMEGFSSSFINYSSSNINISLLPATRGEMGYFCVPYIFMQKLSNDHAVRYRVRYVLSGNNNYSGDLLLSDEIEGKYAYYTYQEIDGELVAASLPVVSGQYILTISLEEKDKEGTFNSIGGITKVINIAPGQTTFVDGTLQPSEFKSVGIDFTIPQISVSMSDVDSKQEKGNSIRFQCTDNSDVDLNVFNRVYYWFVDGEMITGEGDYIDGKCNAKIGGESDDSSYLECSFSSYGRREIKCEVVYIPIASTDVSLRYVGSGMKEVEIIPRSN